MLCAGFWQLGNFLATGTGRQGWKEAMHPQPIIIPPDGGLEITLVCLMRLTDYTEGGGSSVRWGLVKLPQWGLGSGSELVDRALWAPLQHILQMCLHELQPLLCLGTSGLFLLFPLLFVPCICPERHYALVR